MSRCRSCNEKLSDRELKRQLVYNNKHTEYADMCTQCLSFCDNSKYKLKESKLDVLEEEIDNND